jgi:hypothetical protein
MMPDLGPQPPEGWTDVGYTTPAEELPIVQGHRGIDGSVRVDESELKPGRYRVEFEGQLIGEVRVTDPVTHHKTNRADRRRKGQRGRGVIRRRDLYGARWGRD